MPQNPVFVYSRNARITGVIILCCGFSNVAIAVRLIILMAGITTTSITGIAIDGLWSGLPLMITGAWGFYVGTKRNKVVVVAFMLPCFISCLIGVLQAISAGLALKPLGRLMDLKFGPNFDGDCSKLYYQQDACELLENLTVCFLGFLVVSIIGAIASLAGAIITVMFFTQHAQEPIQPSQPGQAGIVTMQPPEYLPSYPYAIGGNHLQVSSSVQQPVYVGQGSCSQQPNTPQVETTRDNVMLTP